MKLSALIADAASGAASAIIARYAGEMDIRLAKIDAALAELAARAPVPGPQGPAGADGARGSDGAAAREWQHRGVWNPERTYALCDVVAKDGGSFLAIAENPGECPGPGWALLAGRGKKGEKGDPA